MEKYTKLMVLSLLSVFIFATSAFPGWKEVVTNNQIRATTYINKLRSGKAPDTVQRPRIRRSKKLYWKSKQARKQMIRMMDDAERLASAGKYKLIKEPIFENIGLSEKRYKELQKKKQ